MRSTLSLAFIILSQLIFGQSFEQLGSNFNDFFIKEKIFTNSLGTPFFAYIQDNNLKVKSFINNTWVDIDNTLPVLDADVKDFAIECNMLTNEIFIVYTKQDGIYYRRYSLSWSSAQFQSVTNGYNTSRFRMSIDQQNNNAYLVYSESPPVASSPFINFWTKINLQTLSSVTIPIPQNYNVGDYSIAYSDLKFNIKDQMLYFACPDSNNYNRNLLRFDGTLWTDAVNPTIFNTSGLRIPYLTIDTSSSSVKDVLLGMLDLQSNYNTFDLRSYAPPSSSFSQLETSFNMGQSSFAGFEINPVNKYITYAYVNGNIYPNQSVIKYRDGNNWNIIDHGLVDKKINDLHFDKDGNMLLLCQNSTNPYEQSIYRSNLFYTSMNENNKKGINIYPNPVSNILTINSQHLFNDYKIYSIEGGLVKEGQLSNSNSQLNMNELTSGVYLIQCTNNNNSYTQKFIKE